MNATNLPVIIRLFNQDTDVLALLRLRQALGGDDTEASLRDQLAWQNQTPEKDRFVAVDIKDDGGVLLAQSFGFHTIPERYMAWVEVHPQYRRKGLGRTLLSHSITRAREVNAEHVLINTNAEDMAAKTFLLQQGLKPKSDAWFLHAAAAVALPEPVWPDGYSVRSFAEIQNIDLIGVTYYKCYGDMWGHGANSKTLAATSQFRDGWQDGWLSAQDPTGEGLFVIFAPDGEAVGLGRGEIGTIEGQKNFAEQPKLHVDGPGIAPGHRQHRLQQPLLLTVMRWLKSRGVGEFSLSSYGDDAATVDIYRDIGFQLDKHLVAFHLDL